MFLKGNHNHEIALQNDEHPDNPAFLKYRTSGEKDGLFHHFGNPPLSEPFPEAHSSPGPYF